MPFLGLATIGDVTSLKDEIKSLSSDLKALSNNPPAIEPVVAPDPTTSAGPSSTCDQCDLYKCTADGKYLYTYFRDGTSSVHTYNGAAWPHAGMTDDGTPMYTKQGDSCYAGNNDWPRIQL